MVWLNFQGELVKGGHVSLGSRFKVLAFEESPEVKVISESHVMDNGPRTKSKAHLSGLGNRRSFRSVKVFGIG